jgi:hypothetical protein
MRVRKTQNPTEQKALTDKKELRLENEFYLEL